MKTTANISKVALPLALVTMLILAVLNGAAQPVTAVSGGTFHSLFLKSDGSLWGMGGDYIYQLGDGHSNQVNRPEMIIPSNVIACAAGYFHSAFIESDGSLWTVGYNYNGELGDGSTIDRVLPVKVQTNVTAVAAGESFTLFIKGDGTLWGMGENDAGELGDGTQTDRATPVMITNDVTAVAAGGSHGLFIRRPTFPIIQLWAMGANSAGQLGDGTTTQRLSPVLIKSYNALNPMGEASVVAVAAGASHSAFLEADGSFWTMGNNANGQLGNSMYGTNGLPAGTSTPVKVMGSNVTAIAAGDSHTMFTMSDSTLWTMGYDVFGQLGNGIYTTNGPQGINSPGLVVRNSVTKIAGGFGHTLFVRDGNLWATGDDNDGQLGTGVTYSGYSQTNVPTLIVIGTPGYNTLSYVRPSGAASILSYVGINEVNYALDRCSNLNSPVWVPQATNPAGAGGLAFFTNTPNPAVNNFWRVRSVP